MELTKEQTDSITEQAHREVAAVLPGLMYDLVVHGRAVARIDDGHLERVPQESPLVDGRRSSEARP